MRFTFLIVHTIPSMCKGSASDVWHLKNMQGDMGVIESIFNHDGHRKGVASIIVFPAHITVIVFQRFSNAF